MFGTDVGVGREPCAEEPDDGDEEEMEAGEDAYEDTASEEDDEDEDDDEEEGGTHTTPNGEGETLRASSAEVYSRPSSLAVYVSTCNFPPRSPVPLPCSRCSCACSKSDAACALARTDTCAK